MMQICALARCHIISRCKAKPGETMHVLDGLETLDPGRTASLDIPGIEPLVIFEKVDVTDINGRPADLHIKARIPMKGIIVEEGRVLIARDILPESRWLTYIQTAECGGPVSDFVDLGEAYHTPILSTAVTHLDPVHLVLRFDTGPEPWDTFRDAVASHHGTITTPE